MTRDPVAALLASGLIIVVSMFACVYFGRKHGVVLASILTFILHIARGYQVHASGDLGDGAQYDQFAVALVRYWHDLSPDPGDWLGKDGFPALLAFMYNVVGHAPETGYLLNALAGALTVPVVAATTAQMGWHAAIKPSAWLVALWPAAWLYGGMLLREAIVTLLLAVGLWGTVRLYQHRVASGVVAILAAGSAMVFMRGGLAFLVLIGMPLTAAVATNLRGRFSLARLLVALTAVGLAAAALFILPDYFEGGRYFEYRAEVSQEQNVGSSSFAQAGVGSSALTSNTLGHAIRIPLAALGPFPWQVTTIGLALAAVDALLWLLVWALAIYAARRIDRIAESLLFMLPLAGLIVALAGTATNFGLIIRLRGQGIVLIAPLAALGYVYWREARQARRARQNQGTALAAPRTPERLTQSQQAAPSTGSMVSGRAQPSGPG